MKKLIAICLAVMLVVGLVAGIGVASGEGHPASKATAKVSNINILSAWTDTSMTWTPILSQTIKTPNQKDLFIDVSLQCGLYTRTKGKSKNPIGEDTAQATSTIKVRVTVDGHPVYPSEVVFCERAQTLTVKLQGILGECPDDGGFGCVVDEEYVELILETMSANSFNFVAADLDAGVHTVTVDAAIDLVESGDAEARATIGVGSVTIEQVRMIKGEDYVILED